MGSDDRMRLYLDTNKWIDLARADLGKPSAEHFQAALARIRKDDVEVVMSGPNAFEIIKNRDPERRARMASIMTAISRGVFLRPFLGFFHREVESRIRESLGWRPLDLRAEVVGAGLSAALGAELRIEGLPPDATSAQAETLSALSSPESTAEAIVRSHNPALEARLAANELVGVGKMNETLRKAREARASKKTLLEHNLAWLFQKVFEPLFLDTVARLRINTRELRNWSGPHPLSVEYLLSHRSADAWVTLLVERDSDPNRAVHPNDIRDLEAMSMAVAYCDIVVVERYFGGLMTRSGLAQRLGCTVLTDLARFPDAASAFLPRDTS